jgi:hypothetical protein
MHHTNTVRRSLIAGRTCDWNPETQALDGGGWRSSEGLKSSTSIATGSAAPRRRRPALGQVMAAAHWGI